MKELRPVHVNWIHIKDGVAKSCSYDGFFHEFFTGADGEPRAIIEKHDGSLTYEYVERVKFVQPKLHKSIKPTGD